MTIANTIWAAKVSTKVFDDTGLSGLKMRAKFVFAAARNTNAVSTMRMARSGTHFFELLRARPEIAGVLVWPYQCSTWPVDQRMNRIVDHCATVDQFGPPLKFDFEERLVLADLDDVFSGLRIVLDQPHWFMREGQFVINVFLGSFRAYSMAFSLYKDTDGLLEAYIGGIQGRNVPEIRETYRALTKALHGLRPRDLLIEAFRMLCRIIGVTRILAVSEASRHHRHHFFDSDNASVDYDEIWQDRGARRIDEAFFELDKGSGRRNIEDVKSKKRSMYRKRYAQLDAIESRMTRGFPDLKPVQFADS